LLINDQVEAVPPGIGRPIPPAQLLETLPVGLADGERHDGGFRHRLGLKIIARMTI
jgi:hypothetical protein